MRGAVRRVRTLEGARLLETGPWRSIQAASRRALRAGGDIVAPACGVTAETPVDSLRAVSRVAKDVPEGDA